MPDPLAPAGTRAPVERLRVRPPRPLEPAARIAVAAMVAVVAALGGLVLYNATSTDQAHGIGSASLDRYLPPAGATLDSFDEEGTIGAPEAMAWTVPEGSWLAHQGEVRSSSDGTNLALVDPGQIDALIDTRIGSVRPGAGVVISEREGDRLDLVVANDGDGWQLVRTLGTQRLLVQLLPGPVTNVVIQVVRRADSVTISFNREAERIELSGAQLSLAKLSGTSLGLIADGPGSTFDRFAYLKLDGGR